MEATWEISKTAGQGKLGRIIEWFEVFIERWKKHDAQTATWSDYISHYTIKFLIGISRGGFITFLSDKYSDRASYKFICGDSRFFDCLNSYDEIMADRVFQITEELILKYLSQMSNSEVRKPKELLTKGFVYSV